MKFATRFFMISMFITLVFEGVIARKFTLYEWYSGLLLWTITGKLLLNDEL